MGILADIEPSSLPRRRLWTYREYEKAAELGIFRPNERLELIEGEIIRKMAPQYTPHATAISLTYQALGAICPPSYYLRIQLPMQLGPKSGPEPDIAVVAGQARDYVKRHPCTAALVVEIADSSLRLDRGVKASLYARAQVPEYWILDLKGRALEVHRLPGRVPDQPLGFHYTSVTRHGADDVVAPLIAPDAAIRVSDLLP